MKKKGEDDSRPASASDNTNTPSAPVVPRPQERQTAAQRRDGAAATGEDPDEQRGSEPALSARRGATVVPLEEDGSGDEEEEDVGLVRATSTDLISPGGDNSVVNADDQVVIRDHTPRLVRIRRGISIASWVVGALAGTIAFAGGVPVGSVLLLIVTGIGYAGSEIGVTAVIARLDRLEGGRLLALAERIGQVALVENIGNRLCVAFLGYSLGTRYRRPTSIANAAQRARIQDRGVEFLALLSALGYGGAGVVRFGITADVVMTGLLTFTTIMSVGRGYLVAIRHGAELHRGGLARILSMQNDVARQARILQGSLYAPTTIGDFLIWCGVVGKPLIRAGFMLPLALLAKILPNSAKNAVLGIVGADVLSEVEEAFISANLLGEGVLPEHVEDVAEKKTTKYKVFWTLIYSIFPFFMGLIPYLVCHFYYQLSVHVATEYIVVFFLGWEATWLVVIGCCFERIDRTISGVLSSCRGICSKEEDHVAAAAITANNGQRALPPVAASTHIAPGNNGHNTVPVAGMTRTSAGNNAHHSLPPSVVGTRTSAGNNGHRVLPPAVAPHSSMSSDTAVVNIDLPEPAFDDSTDSSEPTSRRKDRGLSLGHLGKRSSAADIFNEAGRRLSRPPSSDREARNSRVPSPPPQRDVAFRIPIDAGSALDAATVTAAISSLRMRNVGTTHQGRVVSILEPGQRSPQANLNAVIELNKADTLLFVVDPSDNSNFICISEMS
jgi:hypothetical protein